ncbi:MAG: ketopantoate reductase family protein [Campylobacterales bacterium]|nr:ketopantoate reductase family protein [Campylobacterales bacterium]
MRVAIVGLGGVGGYIAANFVRAGIDVVGFARGTHLEAIRTHGLEIVEDEFCWSAKIDAREEGELDGYFEGAFDVVIFCVKSYDLADAYKNIASHVDDKTVLLSFSNGVDNGDTLRRLSKCRVLDGCVYILSHIEEAGKIRKKGKVFAAIFGGENEAKDIFVALFEKAQLRYKTPEDIQTALWKKYLFISAFATLTSYYDKSIAWVYENHFNEAQELLNEIQVYASKRGIDIADEVEKALQTASKLPADASTSMHLDFKKNKPVELDSLTGYVQMPFMQKLYGELKNRL